MSDQNVEAKTAEKENKVVISAEDCNAALDFWRHFNIPIPSSLQEAVDNFSKDSTFPNQEQVKLQICKAISETDHEAFKDDMFAKIVEECAGVTFDMQFDKDFENTVTTTK